MICTSIGPFEIVKELAIEGSVCVYKAIDSRSGRTVALRTFMSTGSEADQDIKARVLQRAKLASALDSPNIASTYGAGSADGLIFVATEYVDGVSLRALLLKQKKFSIWDLLDYTRQVQLALDHARQCGIVHLNLHPGTIMIELDGTLKILNFGILAPASEIPSDSLRYFSPEQIKGEPLDVRSNLYSWGAILYEAITGTKLFVEKIGDDLRHAILNDPPLIPDVCREGANGAACDVVLKLMSKSPEDRFQCGAEVVRELETAFRPAQPQPKMCSFTAPAVAKDEEAGVVADSEKNDGNPPVAEMPVTRPPVQSQPPKTPVEAPPMVRPPAIIVGRDLAPAARAIVTSPDSQTPAIVVKKARMPRPLARNSRIVYLAGILVVIFAIAVLGRQLRSSSNAQQQKSSPVETAGAQTDAPAAKGTYSDPEAVVVPVAKPKPRRQPLARVEAQPLAPLTGDLVVSSSPAGAQVRIDNDNRSSGVTPFIATELSPGPHTVSIVKDGYAQQAHKVIVEAGRRLSFDVSLTELEAVLAIDSDPQGATILIDGRNSASTTPAHMPLAKGTHSIRLQKPGFFETTTTVQLSPGVTTKVKPALVAMGDTDSIRVGGGKLKRIFGGPGQNVASMQIRSLPKGARVTINGRALEKLTPVELNLAPGNYQLTIAMEGYKPLRKMVTVSATSKSIVEEALEPVGTTAAK